MTSVATLDSGLVSALIEAVDVLRSVAELGLDDELQQRMRDLGENKEACSADQRDEHRQLADFWRRQTLRKVRTLNVLRRLGEIAFELVGSSPGPSEESKSNCCNNSVRTIDLSAAQPRTEDILQLAEGDSLVVRTPNGKTFLIAEMDRGDEAADDFAQEVALIRGNKALRELLAERSREPGRYTLEQVREKLGLRKL